MSYRHLDQAERYHLQAMCRQGLTQAEMARQLGRHPSTISRELRRNGTSGDYCADQAAGASRQRRQVASSRQWKLTEPMLRRIEQLLGCGWTPEQITGRCRIEQEQMLSHEWIYQVIYRDARQGGNLWKQLPQANKRRRKRLSGRRRRGVIPDRVSIEQRPPIVDERVRVGDWEVDTIIGRGHASALLSIVERHSRLLVLRPLEQITAEQTATVLHQALSPYSVETITSDNGKEFARHTRVAAQLGIDWYFAHPYRSCERGTNEQTNALIRRSFPKGTDFRCVSNGEIEAVEHRLNARPRKCLGYRTPWEVYSQSHRYRDGP